jgi:TrmH family RNA methyltransferase
MSPTGRSRALRSANDEFQLLSALLTNRNKRHRAGDFIVQGVRPIDQALANGWTVRSFIHPADVELSGWAIDVLGSVPAATRYSVTPDLMAQLSEKDGAELLAVVAMRRPAIDDIRVHDSMVVVVCDRPQSPGNLGSIIRSADAFGVDAVVVAGHAADPFDPACVRATTGSLFSVPVVQVGGLGELHGWIARGRARCGLRVVGTDEAGEPISATSLGLPLVLVAGNEARGLGRTATELCDAVVAIPIRGTASSLNVANAVSIVLYEIGRSR